MVYCPHPTRGSVFAVPTLDWIGKNKVMNHKSLLIDFYKWLYGSGLNLAMVNNAGDPFDGKEHHTPNTLAFEREVIEYFGPLYGFDPNDVWGIVTFSGTYGNNHGIYFGAKYLEKKTGQKPVVYVSDRMACLAGTHVQHSVF